MVGDDRRLGDSEAEMADDARTSDTPEVALDLDEPGADLETAMREAMAAVEGVETGSRTGSAIGSATPAGSEEVERLRREVADLRDRNVRALADFDNFRKRS